MSEFDAHHLRIGPDAVTGNDGRGRVFLIPGSIARTRRVAEHFTGLETHDNPRQITVFTGQFSADGVTIDVGAVPTGMGCPSLGIVVTELIEIGVRRLVRVGSAGSLQPKRIHTGDLVVARAAVRDEGSSNAFSPREVPAVSHPHWVRALEAGARAHGMAEHTFTGLVHTKDTLYGREFPSGPLAGANRDYMRVLEELGVMASEMESSHLFLLSMAHGPDVTPISAGNGNPDVVKAGSLLAIIGDEDGWAPSELAWATEAKAVEVALRAAVELIRSEREHG